MTPTTRFLRVLGGAALALGVLGSQAIAQTTHQVDLNTISFDPATLNIAEGDTVNWVWQIGNHNVESGSMGTHNGFFRSGDPVPAPNTFSVTFDAAFLSANPAPGNSYDYYCVLHEGFGQVGQINVSAGPAAVPALPGWGLVTALGGIAGAACLVLRKRKRGLHQA